MPFPAEKNAVFRGAQESAGNRRGFQGSRIKNASQLSQDDGRFLLILCRLDVKQALPSNTDEQLHQQKKLSEKA